MFMKSLICINTCSRPDQIKAYVYDFIKFCQENEGYDFVISLDGKDQEVIRFCEFFKIPLIYSEEREGVGISKNRVIELKKDYDFYFFLEDDVELINGSVFDVSVDVAKKENIYHMNLDEKRRYFGNKKVENKDGVNIGYYDYGSASFNFFTRKGIGLVGGFHEEFAKYRRFGHTEHTYRFVNTGLHKRAFIVLEDYFEDYFVWHNPPSVTSPKGFAVTENRLAQVEQNLIDQKLTFFPIKTISKYHFNQYTKNDVRISYLKDISEGYKKVILEQEKSTILRIQQKENEKHTIRDNSVFAEGSEYNLRHSKAFQVGDLFFRSVKNPLKWVTFPFNFVKILLKK